MSEKNIKPRMRILGNCLVAALLLIALACDQAPASDKPAAMSADEFRAASADERARYFNALSEADKFTLLADYLTGTAFVIPPFIEVKFFSNGRAVFDWTEDERYVGGKGPDGFDFRETEWLVRGNTIELRKVGEYDIPDFEGPVVVWREPGMRARGSDLVLTFDSSGADGSGSGQTLIAGPAIYSTAIEEYGNRL